MTTLSSLDRIRSVASRWRLAAAMASNVLLCEVGARVGLPGVDGARVQDFVQPPQLGVLGIYNALVSGGISRGAIVALGAVPYLQAKAYLWLARAAFPNVRRATEAAATRSVLVRTLTIGLAAVQAFGFARFLEHIPGAVARPGVGFVSQTVVLLTGSAVLAGWLGETIATSMNVNVEEDAYEVHAPSADRRSQDVEIEIGGVSKR